MRVLLGWVENFLGVYPSLPFLKAVCVCDAQLGGVCMCVYCQNRGEIFCPLVIDVIFFAWCDRCSILIINAFRSRRVSLFFSPCSPCAPSLSFIRNGGSLYW